MPGWEWGYTRESDALEHDAGQQLSNSYVAKVLMNWFSL